MPCLLEALLVDFFALVFPAPAPDLVLLVLPLLDLLVADLLAAVRPDLALDDFEVAVEPVALLGFEAEDVVAPVLFLWVVGVVDCAHWPGSALTPSVAKTSSVMRRDWRVIIC